MDYTSQFSDTCNHVMESSSSDYYKPESSPVSIESPGEASASISDDEVRLAASQPKKPAGRRVFKETRHPVYRGVRRRNNDKWVCELREPNKKTRIWLGTYPTAEMAARAHDVAAIALRGKAACLNFADSAWRLPKPDSLDPKDIRAAASKGAEAFRPVENGGTSRCNEEEKAMDHEKTNEGGFFMDDEDATLDMPGFISDLAEGLLLPPPPIKYFTGDDVEKNDDVSLWSYSF